MQSCDIWLVRMYSLCQEIVPYKLATHCICSWVLVPPVLLAPGSGLVLEGCWQCRQCPAGWGVGWGSSIWGFPYDPLLTPMLLHRSHLSPACLPALQHSSGRRRCLCLLAARTGSLTLPVAKTRSGAEELTVTLALCRTIALHGPSHERYHITFGARRYSICARNKGTWENKGIHTESSSKLLHKWTHLCENVHAFSGAIACALLLLVHLLSCINICYRSCFPLYSSFSHCLSHKDTVTHRHIHTHKTQWRTLAHCTLCTLPVLVFSCLQMERGSRSFFGNLLFLSPLLFSLASLTLRGSMDVLLESIPAARAINKRRV